jgi:transposase InsO family protein
MKGMYSSVTMNLTHILPGASSLASMPDISKEAKQRLKWMDYYRKTKNVSLVCRYFGISRKTFYQWKKRYDPYHLESLEEKSKRPRNTRKWEVRRTEELRIINLRKKYIRYGKEKLKVIYQNIYQEPISSWKIQRVIEKHSLYYSPVKTLKLRRKRNLNQPKKRITELKKEHRQGFLVAFDGLTIYLNNAKRYIFTAIDIHSKISFARMYKSKKSRNAADFLKRMHYLLEGKIENIQTDNGSEFARHFKEAAISLNIPQYLSRPRTPTDNPFDERFNRTLREEFIQLGNMTSDCEIFNRKLTEWLVEYNFHRPHQSLGYMAPINFHYQFHKVLPMYPSSTIN